jgi:hypothetical protein
MYQNPIAMLAIINSCDKATAQATVIPAPNGGVNGQTLWDVIVDAKDYLAWAQNDGSGGGIQSFYFNQTGAYYVTGYASVLGASVTDLSAYFYIPDLSTSSVGCNGTFNISWGDGSNSNHTDNQMWCPYGVDGYPELSYYDGGPSHEYASSGAYVIDITYTSNGNTVPIMSTTVNVTVGGSACTSADAAQGAGGWRYGPNYGDSDNSVTQWPALALAEAKTRWSIDVNPKVKEMLDLWLAYSQNDNGGFGYTAPADWVNFPKTSAGLIMLKYLGANAADDRVQKTLAYLDSDWNTPGDYWGGNLGSPYAMYAFYKGMKSWGLNDLNGKNWSDIYTGYLVDHQASNDIWGDNAGWMEGNMATFTALAILAPEVASLPPVANAGGPYPNVNPNQVLTLDGSQSYHQDANKNIVAWQWDFDASNGLWWDTKATPDAGEGGIGMTMPVSYPDTGAQKSYIVTLRVVDNSSPPMTGTNTATVNVTTGNVAPVAVTNGPWSGLPNSPITFDGSASFDPNSCTTANDPKCLGDSIVKYEWDLNGDGIFNGAEDGTPLIADFRKVQKSFPTPISLPATLRVTDQHGLTGISTAQFNVVSIAVVYGKQYDICFKTPLNRFQEIQGLRVKFKNEGNAAAENVKMTLTNTPSNLPIYNGKSVTNLGTLDPNAEKFSACDTTAKTADIQVLFDRRTTPTGTWKWRSEFDFNNAHYTVDNIPPLGP